VINLDPANDTIPCAFRIHHIFLDAVDGRYTCAASITEIIDLETVMEKLELGPNGGMVYCMEFLEKNIDWLKEKLTELKGHYFLFDLPGQVELYTHHDSVRRITEMLTKLNYRLCAVHLVDSHYCSDPAKYISVVMISISTMMKLELPHINVLSKIDLVEAAGNLGQSSSYSIMSLSPQHVHWPPPHETPRSLSIKQLPRLQNCSCWNNV